MEFLRRHDDPIGFEAGWRFSTLNFHLTINDRASSVPELLAVKDRGKPLNW